MISRNKDLWEDDESDKSQNSNVDKAVIRQNLLNPKKISLDNIKSTELLRLIRLRNSSEWYSNNEDFNNESEREIKEAKRLEIEGVFLENSPVSYLNIRYDYLNREKLAWLKDEFEDGLISQQQLESKQRAILSEMNLISDIVAQRSISNRYINSFPAINEVYEDCVDKSISFLRQVSDFELLFELFCERQDQIDNFNLLIEVRKHKK
jgi:hypothetical protein